MAATTWQEATRQILEALDLKAEFQGMGLETSGEVSASGWLSCKRFGSGEQNPSAGVKVAPGQDGKLGTYKEFSGSGHSCSFWEFCSTVAKRFATWQDAREHYRKQAKVAAPGGKDPNSQLHFRPWNRSLINTWCLHKPPVTPEAVEAAGGCLADWPAKSRQHTVVALPVWESGDPEDTPSGWVVWNKSGRPLPLFQGPGNPPRLVKMLSVSGSRSGLMGRHGLAHLADAELVWLVEGPGDMLALMSAIPPDLRDRHVVVTHSGGAMETPRPECVARFAGRRVAVVPDADEPGVAGARRWAAALAAVASEVRVVALPYDVTPDHGKDLRDWFTEVSK